ncbi:hypothetical protein [Paraburkholderia jirisanensis]
MDQFRLAVVRGVDAHRHIADRVGIAAVRLRVTAPEPSHPRAQAVYDWLPNRLTFAISWKGSLSMRAPLASRRLINRIYCLYRLPSHHGDQMSTPQIKQPTKKTFHFPKSAEEPATQDAKPSAKAKKAVAAKKAPATVEKKAALKETATKETAPKKAAPKKAAPEKAASKKSTAAAESKTPKAKPAAAPAAAQKEAKDEKARRAKKDKVVRDSFTMPKSDYAKIAELKQRCLEAGVSVKKSELLRAGLALLAVAPVKRLLAAVSELDTVKTGRPASE